MSESFFEKPIFNSPYEYPRRHWELDEPGQAANIVETHRAAKCVTPSPKLKNLVPADVYTKRGFSMHVPPGVYTKCAFRIQIVPGGKTP